MKSKKRHHDTSEESEESISGKSSSSSNSESDDSSVSEHRYKKKKKRAESSDSESNSDDQKRSKKRKHKKKKKKHSKKKRRSDSVEDISDDNISISEGEISTKKKRKHKHKHSKRVRSSSGSEDNDRPVEHHRTLHSVVKERRPSSEGSQHKKTYYQKEYRRSDSVEHYEREREVQRFYRGSSKENRHQYQDNYDREKNMRYGSQAEKYDRPRERYPQVQYQQPREHYGARPKEYQDFKRPQRFEEEDYRRKQRDDTYHREEPRGPLYNAYEDRAFNKRREFVENRDYRERRGPPEPERYREREYVEKRDRFQEERFSLERHREARRERPVRIEKPPPPPRELSKSRSPEDRYREKRREVRDERERREPVDKYREERVERREPRMDREGRSDKEDRGIREKDSREDRDKRPPPDGPRERRTRFDNGDDKKEYSWGKTEVKKEGDGKDGEKEKPNFGLSGKLTADANTVNGVVIKYTEPDDAKQPKRRWRFYPFKGDKALPILYIHRQSCFVMGRDKKVVDIALDHPSISKQHAALQYRATPFTRADGSTGRRVRPYVIDLDSANGTFVNNNKVEPRRYVELLERDVVKFGFSQREYVLLHENSKDDAQDDDQEPALPTSDHIKQTKRVKEEEAADG